MKLTRKNIRSLQEILRANYNSDIKVIKQLDNWGIIKISLKDIKEPIGTRKMSSILEDFGFKLLPIWSLFSDELWLNFEEIKEYE